MQKRKQGSRVPGFRAEHRNRQRSRVPCRKGSRVPGFRAEHIRKQGSEQGIETGKEEGFRAKKQA